MSIHSPPLSHILVFGAFIFSLGEVTCVNGNGIYNSFYQDVTVLIDHCLESGCATENVTNSRKMALEEALSKSMLIYYSTDLLLDEMDGLVPVFHLLQTLESQSAQTSKLSLMLSFRYTHDNRFNYKRLDDVYYNLSLNLSSKTMSFLTNHVSHIVLDWKTDRCQDSSTFFSKPVVFHGFGFESVSMVAKSSISKIPYSFPDYTRNFLRLHCTQNYSTCSKIPVGIAIAYHASLQNCKDASYLWQQMKNADFVLLSHSFPTFPYFPFYYNIFKEQLQALEQQLDKIMSTSWRNGIMYHVDLAQPPNADQVVLQWKLDWPALESLLSSSTFYNKVTRQMIEHTRNQSVHLANKFILRYVTEKESLRGSGLTKAVMGTSIVSYKPQLPLGPKAVTLKSESIPHYFTNEILGTPQLKIQEMTANRFIIDDSTWRALVRFQKLRDPDLNCQNGGSSGNVGLSAILVFNRDTIILWSDLEKHLKQLLTETQIFWCVTVTLSTVVFPETGLNKETSTFITTLNSSPATINYSIGCLVEFTRERLELLRVKLIFAERVQFKNAMQNFCGEIFDVVTTMIWNIGKSSENFDDNNSNHKLILVARQVFLEEFPGKEVIIQRGDLPDSEEFVKSWAEYFQIPVVY